MDHLNPWLVSLKSLFTSAGSCSINRGVAKHYLSALRSSEPTALANYPLQSRGLATIHQSRGIARIRRSRGIYKHTLRTSSVRSSRALLKSQYVFTHTHRLVVTQISWLVSLTPARRAVWGRAIGEGTRRERGLVKVMRAKKVNATTHTHFANHAHRVWLRWVFWLKFMSSPKFGRCGK